MNGWQSLVLDALVIASLTILGALHVIPAEAIIGMLGTFVGARAMQRLGGPKDPPAGGAGVAAGSVTLALLAVGAAVFAGRSHA